MNRCKIIRVAEVLERTGMSKTTIDRLERAGKFPKRVKISDRAVGWHDTEINKWLESRKSTFSNTEEVANEC